MLKIFLKGKLCNVLNKVENICIVHLMYSIVYMSTKEQNIGISSH